MIDIINLKVHLKNIHFTYHDHTFKKHKITFVTGKNGTGKTTLLKVIADLLDYDGDVNHTQVITYNNQEPVIFNRTVKANIQYPLEIRSLPLDDYEDAIQEYSKLLEVDYLLDKNASKLSSGEKMKVSILRSIIFHPDVVLLDEPTTHLDLDSINNLISLIKQLKNTITFIIVSHNKAFMDELVDDVYEVGETNVHRETN